jgi:VanZ family protein
VALAFTTKPVVRVAFAVTVVAILVLALMPASHSADWFPQADKLRHALAFITLWMLGVRARFGRGRGLSLAAGLLLFGVGIEVAQSFTPDRDASAFDVMADTLGIGLGWLFQRPAA